MGGDKCRICENVNCIGDICVFHNLNDDETDYLNQRKKIVNYHKKDVVRIDDDKSTILFICAGFAKVYLYGYFNKKFLVEIIRRNSIVHPLLNQNVSNQTIIALNDMRVCSINSRDIINVCERDSMFSIEIWKRINTKSSNYLERISSIALKHTRGKLADVLLYIEKKFKGINIYEMITRKDIADFANISNENAIRTLNEFVTDGVISNEKKLIEIINHEALLKISKLG